MCGIAGFWNITGTLLGDNARVARQMLPPYIIVDRMSRGFGTRLRAPRYLSMRVLRFWSFPPQAASPCTPTVVGMC